MKVIMVTAALTETGGGGVYSAVRLMSRALVDKGVDVEVFGPVARGEGISSLDWSPVSVKSFPAYGPVRFLYAPALTRGLMEAVEGDEAVIHLHGIWTYALPAAAHAAAETETPFVVSPHGMLDSWALRQNRAVKNAAIRLYVRKALKESSCVHTLSDSEASAVKDLGIDSEIAVIANGADAPGEDAPDAFDPAPGEWTYDRILLFLGRLHRKKGLLPLVEGWKESGIANSGWRLVIAGPDQDGFRSRLEKTSVEHDCGDSIRFVGPRYGEDKHCWFSRADAFILPSFSEGVPVSALEAMAYGLPVIMTGHCNLPSAFGEGAALECGTRPESISGALRRLAEMSEDERNLMGSRARLLVEKQYSWDRVADKRMDGYRRILRKGEGCSRQ